MPAQDTAAYVPRRQRISRHVHLRGLNHYFNEWGQANERPTLVMLHGWMDVGASFQFVVDAMDDRRHIIAPDWRGFGLTDSPAADCYWFPDYLGDLDALLDHVSPGRAVDLLGHSMGGNVAMQYAGVRPERIHQLVNLEGFGVPHSEAELAPKRLAQWLDELKTPQELRSYATVNEVAQRLMKTNPRLAADKAEWLAPHWSRQAADGRWHILGDAAHKRVNPVLTRREEVMATWSQITAPLLWVQGSDTQMEGWWQGRYTRAEFEQRLSHVKQVEQHVLSPAGHMLHHDQPEVLAARLQTFLT